MKPANRLSDSLSREDIQMLMFAGNATLTFESQKTGKYYTFNIRASKADFKDKRVYFVSLLHGPENTSDFAYLGIINKDTMYFDLTGKSRYTEDSIAVKAFRYTFDKLRNQQPMSVNIYHEGKCAKCGRKLTTPESIRNGIGPECMKMNR
jgi:hypothetical protein